jgi:molybdopterin/thiamine biosynthesis adenylyltransferase
MNTTRQLPAAPAVGPPAQTGLSWSYDEAFVRNRGLISPEEQERLRHARVAIAGMGGIGGIDLVTFARLGIGRFSIADPETFAVANTNRQFGAMASTIGRSKAQVMAQFARDINPEVDLRVFEAPIGPDNVAEFLRDADVFIDAVEVFEADVRRQLFRQAAAQGIYGITGGPVGFSGIWISFDPKGMSFDSYFDFSDDMSPTEKLVAFAAGVAPKATHRPYMDLKYLDVSARTAPSCAAACHLAAAAIGSEVVKILLKKGKVRPAPYYQQFDPFVGRYARGYLWMGNRHPFQRLKRWWLKRFLENWQRQRSSAAR